MLWREPQDLITDCYFCLANVKGYTDKTRNLITCPHLNSVTRPMPHTDDASKPSFVVPFESASSSEYGTMNTDSEFEGKLTGPLTFFRTELNDLGSLHTKSSSASSRQAGRQAAVEKYSYALESTDQTRKAGRQPRFKAGSSGWQAMLPFPVSTAAVCGARCTITAVRMYSDAERVGLYSDAQPWILNSSFLTYLLV